MYSKFASIIYSGPIVTKGCSYVYACAKRYDTNNK